MVTCSDTRIFLSVTTSCEIRRLVSSSPPAPPNRRHWISPPPSPQLRLLARYADSYLSVRRRLRIDVTGYLRPSSPQLRLLARYADSYLSVRRRLRIDVTGYLRRHPLSCDFLRDTPTRICRRLRIDVTGYLRPSLQVPSQVHISHVLDPIHQRQIECRTTEMSQLPLTLNAGMRSLACSFQMDQMPMVIFPPLLHRLQLKLPLLRSLFLS